MTGDLSDLGRAVGWTSLAVAAAAAAAPSRLARAAGVRSTSPASDVVVRFAAARQAALGLALLTRRPLDMGRASGLFLPVTTVDAVAAVAGVRAGTLERRAAVMALAVAAANAAIALRVRATPR